MKILKIAEAQKIYMCENYHFNNMWPETNYPVANLLATIGTKLHFDMCWWYATIAPILGGILYYQFALFGIEIVIFGIERNVNCCVKKGVSVTCVKLKYFVSVLISPASSYGLVSSLDILWV